MGTYEQWAKETDLLNIYLVKNSAQRLGNFTIDEELTIQTTIDTQLGELRKSEAHDDTLDYRFVFDFLILADERKIAEISATYVTSFSAPGTSSQEDKKRFAVDVAVMAAYPYAREFLQTSAQRLEIPGVTLNLLKRGGFTMESAEGAS